MRPCASRAHPLWSAASLRYQPRGGRTGMSPTVPPGDVPPLKIDSMIDPSHSAADPSPSMTNASAGLPKVAHMALKAPLIDPSPNQ